MGRIQGRGILVHFECLLFYSVTALALYTFARTMHIMHIMTLNGHNIENSICCKNVIPVLWKEFLSLWNCSGIRVQREQREVNEEVT